MQDNMLGQNIIITEKIGTLRQLGRNALRGKWPAAIIAVLIYIICMRVPVLIMNQLFGINPGNLFTTEGYTYQVDPELYSQLYNQMPHYSVLAMLYLLLVSGAFELGLMIYFLASFRGHIVGVKDVFLGFERFGKALGLFLFRLLFIYLWSLLFIIPGIIASIRYSQAFFVLADDPQKSIRQCMDESKAMMRGNKGTYFLLSLSFIGWFLLAAIPGGFLQGIAETVSNNEIVQDLAEIISAMFLAPVYAYLYSTFAGFYEILAGHLIKETSPAPLSPDQIFTDAPVEKIEAVIESIEGRENDAETEDEIAELEAKAGLTADEDAAQMLPEETSDPFVQPEIPEEFRSENDGSEE